MHPRNPARSTLLTACLPLAPLAGRSEAAPDTRRWSYDAILARFVQWERRLLSHAAQHGNEAFGVVVDGFRLTMTHRPEATNWRKNGRDDDWNRFPACPEDGVDPHLNRNWDFRWDDCDPIAPSGCDSRGAAPFGVDTIAARTARRSVSRRREPVKRVPRSAASRYTPGKRVQTLGVHDVARGKSASSHAATFFPVSCRRATSVARPDARAKTSPTSVGRFDTRANLRRPDGFLAVESATYRPRCGIQDASASSRRSHRSASPVGRS